MKTSVRYSQTFNAANVTAQIKTGGQLFPVVRFHSAYSRPDLQAFPPLFARHLVH